MFDTAGRQLFPMSDGSDCAAGEGSSSGGDDVDVADACWVALVDADVAALRAGWQALLESGIDPADPFAWDVCDEFVEEAWSGLGGAGAEQTPFAQMVPSVELAGLLDAFPVEDMTAYELADAVAAWERLGCWVQAKQAEAITALTRRPEVRAGAEDVRYSSLRPEAVTAGDLCTVWPWTKPQADRLVSRAVPLVQRFPDTCQAMTKGRIDARRAQILMDELCGHDDEVAQLVEAAVLPHVHRWTSVKVRTIVRRLLHELAPETMQQRRRQAHRRRGVWIEPDADGMVWLHAYLSAEEAAAIMAVLNAAADSVAEHGRGPSETNHDGPGSGADDDIVSTGTGSEAETEQRSEVEAEPRSLDERRADALAGLAWSSLFTGRLGGSGCAMCGSPFGVPLSTAHGRPVTVNMTMPLSTWLRLDEHPAELEGFGPIDAETGRRLAAAGVWRWVVTDPVGGWALDYGRKRYNPPQELVDFVLLRDQECIMPGCHQPAYRCEIDHRDPFPYGPTSACNCSALCKPCHLQKHRAGWGIEHIEPGVQRWTSPTGHQQVVALRRVAPTQPDPDPEPPPDTGPTDRLVPPF